MAKGAALPFFLRGNAVVESAAPEFSPTDDFHFDLLSFLSIARKFGVDLVKVTWQSGLARLGSGATSAVEQAQIDAELNLAFKRSIAQDPDTAINTDTLVMERFKALIFEVIALETLRAHPGVVNLLGITWETEASTGQVWPVILTERSKLGTMAEYLSSENGKQCTLDARLELCRQIMKACQAMHNLGVIHGDIKQENVLVFNTRDDTSNSESADDSIFKTRSDGLVAKVIDFGYSCFGTSESTQVTLSRTRPWQAPEHENDKLFSLAAARKMDLFSFGMLVWRTILFDVTTISTKRLGIIQTWQKDLEVVNDIDEQKSTSHFLNVVKEALNSVHTMPSSLKSKLRQLFDLTLHHDAEQRAESFDDLEHIFVPESTSSKSTIAHIRLDELRHEILEIGNILADIDDDDYLLHRALVDDLKSRTNKRTKCPCYEHAAKQLWFCNEIGFGLARNPEEASRWLLETSDPGLDKVGQLKLFDEKYVPSNPDRLNLALGYEQHLPWDPVAIYRIQNRLQEAEAYFRMEVTGREESFGNRSRSYLSQLSTLALIYLERNKIEEAVSTLTTASEACEDVYGPEDIDTITALNYLGYALYRAGRWSDVELLQLRLIPIKEGHKEIGPTDATTLNSKNTLAAAYCMQGRYRDCLQIAQPLAEYRAKHIGPEQPETLTTKTWICRALLESGDIEGLETLAKELVEAHTRALGAHDVATLQVKEIYAAVLLGLSMPRQSSLDLTLLERAHGAVLEVIDKISPDDSESDITMTHDADDGEVNWEDSDQDMLDSNTLASRDVVIYLRARTTLICILALKGAMEEAEAEAIATRDFTSAAEGNLERRRLLKAIEIISQLKLLLQDQLSHGEDHHKRREVESLQRKLAHRW